MPTISHKTVIAKPLQAAVNIAREETRSVKYRTAIVGINSVATTTFIDNKNVDSTDVENMAMHIDIIPTEIIPIRVIFIFCPPDALVLLGE